MPATLTIVRQRGNRRSVRRRSAEQRTQRAGLGCGLAFSILAAMVILAVALLYVDLTHDMPSLETLPTLLNPPGGLLLQPTRIYDRTGQHLIAVLAPTDAPRRYLYLDQLPEALVKATLALTDPGFWDHDGYTWGGWDDPESHPTLAQELVSDLLLWSEPASLRRAVRERIQAAQITSRYGHAQVLEWYLNSANYGHFAYGVEAAAQLYFGKSATQLDLSESALLASIAQAPALNPFDTPQAAEQRRQETLEAMMAMRMIGESEAILAFTSPPDYLLPDSLLVGGEKIGLGKTAPAFVELAISQLGERFSRTRVEHGGLDIISTLDYELQMQVACTVQAQLARLAGDSIEILAADGSACGAARLLPTLPAGLPQGNTSASALVLDPRTGQVLAAVGEMRLGQEAPFMVSQPVGSLITPFIYLTGFTRGLSPASLVWDIPGRLLSPDGQYHGPVRLRTALVNDYLLPAVSVHDQMGEANVEHILESFGLQLQPGVRLFEEDPKFSALELAGAYGIFAYQGTLAGQTLSGDTLHSSAVLKVTGVDHSAWADWTVPQTQLVVSPQLAYLVNHVLSDETARWPSLGHPNPLEIGQPAGAKLGSSFAGEVAWLMGFTPQRVVVVWVSQDEDEAEDISTRLAVGLWHALMQYSVRGLPVESWPVPPEIIMMDVCEPSGLLPTDACPDVVAEVFIQGNEPTQVDSLYQTFRVNRETGYLATVFTPPEMVEDRVYFVIPPEARSWAESAGLPAPPNAYDTIQQPPHSLTVHFTSPPMFSDVRGVLAISGTAECSDFAYYRLEYGQGLNPQAWVQIGSDVTSPVEESVLAEWDTSGLNGLYALRLIVVDGDQRIETAVTQVTLDNQAPKVVILFPQPEQTFDYQIDRQITFQVQVVDSYLAGVEFYVDDQLAGEASAAPFSLVWPVTQGSHVVRVMAYDRAGNQAEASVSFNVTR